MRPENVEMLERGDRTLEWWAMRFRMVGTDVGGVIPASPWLVDEIERRVAPCARMLRLAGERAARSFREAVTETHHVTLRPGETVRFQVVI